ncbi:beta/alpha barrel domain-containing protein [Streptomyces griseofuscus]|uniref:hypothetical protein n=1 Tax=Streptomyces griseofuscus TaxID=146922 RepID=UPI003822BEBE
MDRTLARAVAFRADGVVVPGAVASEAVEKLVAGVDGPLNVMSARAPRPSRGSPQLDVARIGAGAALVRV